MGSETLVSTIIRKSIMTHIMNSGSFVISDISEDTGYTVTTVAKYVSKLIEEGLLNEVDRINLHSKGRKTIRYGLSADNRYFLGVDISAFEMTIGLMNLSGEIIKIEKDTSFRLENNSVKRCFRSFVSSMLTVVLVHKGRIEVSKPTICLQIVENLHRVSTNQND